MSSHASEMAARRRPSGPVAVIVVAAIVGLILRSYAISVAPLNSYKPDHRDNMTWSDYAWRNGPLKIYDLPRLTPLLERGDLGSGTTGVGITLLPHACNYPPLSAFIFWLQGALWHALDRDVQTVPLAPETASQLGVQQVVGRVLETPAARITQAVPSILFDIPLAFGVAALVATLRRTQRWHWPEALAFAITFLAPPVILDSAFWNQTDSWITAPLVWAVWALVTGRLTLAGVFWGIALLIKPQGILLAPIVAYFALAALLQSGGGLRSAFKLWKVFVACVLAILAITLPFMIHDARHADGPFHWFKRSYVATIGAEDYKLTTLNAFNVWWLHWMAQDASPNALDAGRVSLGIERAKLGKLLLAAGILLCGGLCGRFNRWSNESLVPLTATIFLAAFLLPTSVHERYIYYCIPFFIAMAVLRPALWGPPLVVLLTVGTAELLAFRWVKLADPAVRSLSSWFAVAALLAFAWSLFALTRKSQQ